ncbi:MAG: regulatory iron-sulfur-containing complex subunit RicT [Vulcanimicrobiota bacterium]
MNQVLVEFHPIEPLVPFWCESASGPVVASTPRGLQLGWIRQTQALAARPFPSARAAALSDLKTHQQRKLFAAEALHWARRQPSQLKLESAYQTLDGELLVFHFHAEERIDFRPLVKALAQQYRKKIELFQLNPRRRTQEHGAALGRCGLECCCTAWLREFPSVSVRMAEEQGFLLQPEAITGVCGRMLCCLRYEYESFLEQRQQPQPGELVDTPEGRVRVLEVDEHTRTLKVEDPHGNRFSIPIGRAKKSGQCDSCRQGTGDSPL